MKSECITEWLVRVRLPDDAQTDIVLHADAAHAKLWVEQDGLRFSVPTGQHVYVSSKTNTNFAVPPARSALPLQPDCAFVLRGDCTVDGGQAALWLIEYDTQGRLAHWSRPLQSGRLDVEWTTHQQCKSCCLAIRLAGEGKLRLSELELAIPTDGRLPRTGPAGHFRAPSIFFDPSGYKPYVEKHHRFYDQRQPDWYERVARPFAGCSSVLEIGCGPGLLLEALRDVGVSNAFGLERDPVYLETCRAHGRHVIQHDLNEPFPFIESASVDGVVSHSSFDYLAPIAARTALRECLRVLRPGGLFHLEARRDGQASGDETRCSVALTPEMVRRLLQEAGFEQIEVSAHERMVRASGRRPVDTHARETRTVALEDGHRGCPQFGRRTFLPPANDAWDHADNRDFTVQTDTRKVALDKETQCTLRLAPKSAGCGAVVMLLEGQGRQTELRVHGDGQCTRDGTPLCEDVPLGTATAAFLRILLPPGAPGELVLAVWHGEQRAIALHEVLDFVPETLRVSIIVPPGEPTLIVDHVDIWQPELIQVEACGDAHMCMGVCRAADELLPDINQDAFRAALQKHDIGRAIVTTYGSTPQLDSFDQISPLIGEQRGCIYPLIRVRAQENPTKDDKQFQVNQLELLWQKGLLSGLKVSLGGSETPSPELLRWAEQRQALTMWHVGSAADLAWLRKNVLESFTFPVLLSHFGGYPLDRSRYKTSIELLDRHPQLYLVTSVVFFAKYLKQAIRRHPDRVLLGSDYPGVDPTVARAAIMALDVPEASKVIVTSENLRFLGERVAWHRWNALRRPEDLLFPPLPETPEATLAQGFEIVSPREMPQDEPQQAREYWSGVEVSPFYLEHKPWAALVAQLARDLEARSVLEFGCHVGRNLAAIRDANPEARLIGLDINEQAVRAGRERSGLDLRFGDQTTLSEFRDGEFDLVFTVSVLDHIPAIDDVCRELIRVAARNVLFLEVTLPVEGKVVQHFDHRRGGVRPSTEASYSWFVDRHIAGHPRIWRLDSRPCYLHPSRLGPYYWSYLAFLAEPG